MSDPATQPERFSASQKNIINSFSFKNLLENYKEINVGGCFYTDITIIFESLDPALMVEKTTNFRMEKTNIRKNN